MSKTSQPNPSKDMVTVYGKVSKDMAEQLDRLAEDRRWSRAQMVAYCIEHFVEQSRKAGGGAKSSG